MYLFFLIYRISWDLKYNTFASYKNQFIPIIYSIYITYSIKRSLSMSYFDFSQDHSFILPTWTYYIYYILYYLNIYIPNFFYLLWALSLTFLTNKREQETHFLYFCFQNPYCIANAHTKKENSNMEKTLYLYLSGEKIWLVQN
jgi:hypothetical protein